MGQYDQAFWVHLLVHPLGFVLGVGLHANEAVEPAMGPGIEASIDQQQNKHQGTQHEKLDGLRRGLQANGHVTGSPSLNLPVSMQ